MHALWAGLTSPTEMARTLAHPSSFAFIAAAERAAPNRDATDTIIAYSRPLQN
jgi:hypothetical protein